MKLDKDILKGIKQGLGIFLFFGLIFGVYGSFHYAYQIIPGIFQGDYEFNGSLNVTNNFCLGGVCKSTWPTTSGIPSGAVVAFNLVSCPTGWSEANGTSGNPDLRGEFIRGLDNGRGVDSGRVLASWQEGTGIGSETRYAHSNNFINDDGIISSNSISTNSNDNSYSTTEYFYRIKPRNVALLYCVKN